MALVRTSVLVQQISGSVGSVVFSNARAGCVAGKRPCKSRTPSRRTLEQQARIATLTSHWRSLTTDQQAQWRTAGTQFTRTNRLGHRCKFSGYELFMRENVYRNIAALAIEEIPPLNLTAPGPESAAFFTALPTIRAYAHVGEHQTNRHAWFFAQRCCKTSLSKTPYWTFIVSSAGTSTSIDNITTPFVAALGAPQVGEVIRSRIIVQAEDCLVSQPFISHVTCS